MSRLTLFALREYLIELDSTLTVVNCCSKPLNIHHFAVAASCDFMLLHAVQPECSTQVFLRALSTLRHYTACANSRRQRRRVSSMPSAGEVCRLYRAFLREGAPALVHMYGEPCAVSAVSAFHQA